MQKNMFLFGEDLFTDIRWELTGFIGVEWEKIGIWDGHGYREGPVWLNGRAFTRDPKGRGFESRPVRFQVTALGKLLTRMCLCHQAI